MICTIKSNHYDGPIRVGNILLSVIAIVMCDLKYPHDKSENLEYLNSPECIIYDLEIEMVKINIIFYIPRSEKVANFEGQKFVVDS